MKRLFLSIAILGIIAGLLLYRLAMPTGTHTAQNSIDSVPTLNITNLYENKSALTSEDLLSSPFALVNFWASWCPPCRTEHPELIKIAARNVLPIYGINLRDNKTKALAFINGHGNPFTKTAFDPTGSSAVGWGVIGLPETFLIDGSGKILKRFKGPITDKIFEDSIMPLLNNAAE